MSKSECKECLHYDVCLYKPCVGECPLYKSKSLFVELPCEVGTPVFFFVEDVESKVFNGKVVSITYEQNTVWIYCRYENGLTYHHTIDDFGKTLFIDEEQAKEKLKEVQK